MTVPSSANVSFPINGVDPRVALATNLHSAPGVYAALVGSGISSSAGIPTGWQVVEDLIRTVAKGDGVDEADFAADPVGWWIGQGRPWPSYSSLLSELARTDAARQALLRPYFDPSPAQGGPVLPTPAHRALARLAADGCIKLIVTTNFDRLIERALDEEGIYPQVIANASAIRGMTPLPHAPMTLIKLHGDYTMLGQRNTEEELSRYPRELNRLLMRIFDEYGLLVIGWSGEYDTGLVNALKSSPSRRYPMFWASFHGALTEPARDLIAQHRASEVRTSGADEFLIDVVAKLERLNKVAARRGRPTPLRSHMFMPNSSSAPSEWAFLPTLQIRAAALFGPASVDSFGLIRERNRDAIITAMRNAPITNGIRDLGILVAASRLGADSQSTAVGSEPLVEWKAIQNGHQSQTYACYRLGGDATKGVSALVTIRFPEIGAERMLITIDIAVSTLMKLRLANIATLFRDALIACTSLLPEALTDIMSSDTEITQAEIHLLAATHDGRGSFRPNNMKERIDFTSLGDSTRALGESLGFAARLSAPLDHREASELVLEGIEYMALDSGFLHPALGLTTLRSELLPEFQG